MFLFSYICLDLKIIMRFRFCHILPSHIHSKSFNITRPPPKGCACRLGWGIAANAAPSGSKNVVWDCPKSIIFVTLEQHSLRCDALWGPTHRKVVMVGHKVTCKHHIKNKKFWRQTTCRTQVDLDQSQARMTSQIFTWARHLWPSHLPQSSIGICTPDREVVLFRKQCTCFWYLIVDRVWE